MSTPKILIPCLQAIRILEILGGGVLVWTLQHWHLRVVSGYRPVIGL